MFHFLAPLLLSHRTKYVSASINLLLFLTFVAHSLLNVIFCVIVKVNILRYLIKVKFSRPTHSERKRRGTFPAILQRAERGSRLWDYKSRTLPLPSIEFFGEKSAKK